MLSRKKATRCGLPSVTRIQRYADNIFLPFNLLAARTFLPPFVLILALNP